MILTLDLETTTHNKGNPYDSRNFIVTIHTKFDEGSTVCSYYKDADFYSRAKQGLEECSLVIGCAIKFDLSWLRRAGIRPRNGIRIWDVSLAEFILSGQTRSLPSLNELAELNGLRSKEPVVAEYWAKGISTEDIPLDVVESYGNWDVDLTYLVYLCQMKDPRMTPELEKLILLCGLDLLVLADMEYNGFKYNVEGSRERAETLGRELEEIERELNSYSPTRLNWDSGDQLSCFLYGGSFNEDIYLPVTKVYKSGPKKGQEYVRNEFQRTEVHRFERIFAPIRGTELAKSTPERGVWSTAEPTLLKLKGGNKRAKRIISLLLRRAYLGKLINTYLAAMPKLIERMNWSDNMIHGQFNQTIARTGRLSSSNPNMQNAPEEVDEFFISRF